MQNAKDLIGRDRIIGWPVACRHPYASQQDILFDKNMWFRSNSMALTGWVSVAVSSITEKFAKCK
ncbi:hypothetical protein DESC_300079 [Desulfosarcina cetonica]|nr:hypothetical protein DESC_300079 [Desulfosarcina cetonica]